MDTRRQAARRSAGSTAAPDLLREAEDYSANARVYRDAAYQRALWAAWALALDDRPMDLTELRRLLDRAELMRALKRHVEPRRGHR